MQEDSRRWETERAQRRERAASGRRSSLRSLEEQLDTDGSSGQHQALPPATEPSKHRASRKLSIFEALAPPPGQAGSGSSYAAAARAQLHKWAAEPRARAGKQREAETTAAVPMQLAEQLCQLRTEEIDEDAAEQDEADTAQEELAADVSNSAALISAFAGSAYVQPPSPVGMSQAARCLYDG